MRVLVFDVMETLLDLRALDPVFESVFGDAGVRQQWFQQMLQSAFVSIATDAYRDFGQIERAALTMTAQRRGVELAPDDQQRIMAATRQLPPHGDVLNGLARLRESVFRTAALTNSTADVAEAAAPCRTPGLPPVGDRPRSPRSATVVLRRDRLAPAGHR